MANLVRRDASSTSGGELTSSAQTIPGAKTFTGAVTLSGGQVGKTDGAAIAAGYVGEVLTATIGAVTLTSSGTTYNAASLALTAGVWQVFGKIAVGAAGTTEVELNASISTTSATHDSKYLIRDTTSTLSSKNIQPLSRYVNTSGATVYLTVDMSFTGTAPATTTNTNFYAVRIA